MSDEVERIRIALGDLVDHLAAGEIPLAPKLPRERLRDGASAHLVPTLTPPLSHTVIEERAKG